MQKAPKDRKYLDNLRHSCAHLLAAAVANLWPKAKPTIGPSIESGFYYDFDFARTKISEDDFPKIEKEMHKIIQGWNKFEKREVSENVALKQFSNNVYKKELIKEFTKAGEKLTLYKSGNFEDLCRGGHVENPKKELKHFKLLSIAGAYWRGDEKNKMLTRIYGTCFPAHKELSEHLRLLEEAKEAEAKPETAPEEETPKRVMVNFVLDESGSMSAVRESTISAFNEYVNTLKQEKTNTIKMTLTKFNSDKINRVYLNTPIAAVPELNRGSYNPASTTPLYDAVG
ncbi:hypothetical protein IID22_04065, partial [Patescibacteria group bacterium]|nr:hypothetical protein [Patescibacteria group bacterium]